MESTSFELEIKVVIVGNGKIGKTSMMNRFVDGSYSSAYTKTIGTDFLEKRIYVPSVKQNVAFYLWDTAGQEEYNGLTRSYYAGAGAAVVAFSTTDRVSFLAVRGWVNRVREICGNIPIVLVQNKLDLLSSAVVTTAEAEGLAKQLGLKLFRTCVKENNNVNEVFEQLCQDCLAFRKLHGRQTDCPASKISPPALQNQESINAPEFTGSKCLIM